MSLTTDVLDAVRAGRPRRWIARDLRTSALAVDDAVEHWAQQGVLATDGEHAWCAGCPGGEPVSPSPACTGCAHAPEGPGGPVWLSLGPTRG